MDDYYYGGMNGYNPLSNYYPVGISGGMQRGPHEVTNAAAMWGVPALEISPKQAEFVGRGARQAIKQISKMNDMQMSVHVNPSVDLGSYDSRQAKTSLNEAMAAVHMAKDIGVKKVVIHPSMMPEEYADTVEDPETKEKVPKYLWDKSFQQAFISGGRFDARSLEEQRKREIERQNQMAREEIERQRKIIEAAKQDNNRLAQITHEQELNRLKNVIEENKRRMERLRKENIGERFVPLADYLNNRAEKNLAKVAAEAKKAGIDLCVEEMYEGYYFDRPERVNNIVEKLRARGLSNVFTTFDVGHAMIGAGPNKKAALKKIQDHINRLKYIKHVHVTDNFGHTDVHLPPGEGLLGKEGYDEVMKMLKAKGILTGDPEKDVGKIIAETADVLGKIGPYRTAAGWSEFDLYHTPEGYGIGDVSLTLSGALDYPAMPEKRAKTWSGLNPW